VAEKEDEEVVQRVLLLLDTLQGYQDLLIRSACTVHITAEIIRSMDTLDCVETKVFTFIFHTNFLTLLAKTFTKYFRNFLQFRKKRTEIFAEISFRANLRKNSKV
jgi:hypothetical protein